MKVKLRERQWYLSCLSGSALKGAAGGRTAPERRSRRHLNNFPQLGLVSRHLETPLIYLDPFFFCFFFLGVCLFSDLVHSAFFCLVNLYKEEIPCLVVAAVVLCPLWIARSFALPPFFFSCVLWVFSDSFLFRGGDIIAGRVWDVPLSSSHLVSVCVLRVLAQRARAIPYLEIHSPHLWWLVLLRTTAQHNCSAQLLGAIARRDYSAVSQHANYSLLRGIRTASVKHCLAQLACSARKLFPNLCGACLSMNH